MPMSNFDFLHFLRDDMFCISNSTIFNCFVILDFFQPNFLSIILNSNLNFVTIIRTSWGWRALGLPTSIVSSYSSNGSSGLVTNVQTLSPFFSGHSSLYALTNLILVGGHSFIFSFLRYKIWELKLMLPCQSREVGETQNLVKVETHTWWIEINP